MRNKQEIQSSNTERELNELTLILAKYSNNPEGAPPLHYAVLKNDGRAISLLLKHGVDPLSVCSKNNSCLYYAIRSGSLSLVKKFITLGNNPIDLCNRNAHHGYDATTMSLKLGQYEAAKYFIRTLEPTAKRLMFQGSLLIQPNACGFTLEQRKELIGLMATYIITSSETIASSALYLLEKLQNETRCEHDMAEFLKALSKQ